METTLSKFPRDIRHKIRSKRMVKLDMFMPMVNCRMIKVYIQTDAIITQSSSDGAKCSMECLNIYSFDTDRKRKDIYCHTHLYVNCALSMMPL